VLLAGVVGEWAVVAAGGAADRVAAAPVPVVVEAGVVGRARVARVADAVAVGVRLGGIRHVRRVVAGVAAPVAVPVLLVRILPEGAVVEAEADAVAVQ